MNSIERNAEKKVKIKNKSMTMFHHYNYKHMYYSKFGEILYKNHLKYIYTLLTEN